VNKNGMTESAETSLRNSKFWSGKNVLITGGTGFIGSHLTERLYHAGARLTVASRTGKSRLWPHRFQEKDIRYLQGDLREQGFARDCCRDQEVVFHFASKIAGLGYNSKHPAEMMTDNILLDFQVLRASIRHGVGIFFYPSGALVYDQDAASPVTEQSPILGEPVQACKGASWAKRSVEKAIEYYREEYNMKIVVTRFSNLYGPGDDCDPQTAHLMGNTIRQVAQGEAPEIWGDGAQLRAYLYVTEALEGILRLMEREENLGPINMGGQREISVKEVVERIIQISGKPIQIRFHPEGPTGLSRKILDIGQLTRLIEFQESISLKEGLHRTWEWYQSRILNNSQNDPSYE
jgi:GDP-L-fucose synthase